MFGSKAYVHKNECNVDKTFNPKAYEGILVGYDEEHIKSYRIFVPSTNNLIILTHVTIDEESLKLDDLYPFSKAQSNLTLSSSLPKHIFDNDIDVKSVSDFDHLIGTHHRDDEDGMIYQTTCVCDENGLIVVYRWDINKNGWLPKKEDGPLHVYDIEKLTNDNEPIETPIVKSMCFMSVDDIYSSDELVEIEMVNTSSSSSHPL